MNPATAQDRPRSITSMLANPTFPSLYAWAATVAAPSVEAGSPAARTCAVLALAACVSGGVLVSRSRVWGRALGIYGFVALCVLCWLFLDEARSEPSPVRLMLGSLGWVAFAFGWGMVRQPGSVPEEHPAALGGQPLTARAGLPWRATLALWVAMAGAGSCLALAWQIERAPHAVLGHLLGLMAAGALLIAAGRFAVIAPGGARTPPPPLTRLRRAGSALGLLGALLALALVRWWLMER